jgi:signal transduction histidine kinase
MRGESGASNIAGMKLPFPELTMPRPTSRQVLADAGLAVGLTVLSWLQLATPPFAGMDRFPGGMGGREFFMRGHPASLLAFAVVALAFLPLAGRRRFPLTVLVVTGVATALYSFMLLPQSFALLALLIALYTVGTLYDRWRLVAITIAVGLLSLAVASPDWNSTVFFAEVARILAPIIVAAALGDAARNRRAFLEEAQQRVLAAEATREEETRRRVDEERLRIARDLHDITAHSLSLIAVQSGVAAHVLDSDPEEARRSLLAIRETSRSALHELRGLLGVLRGAGDGPAPLAPAPSLARLSELTDPLHAAGFAHDGARHGDLAGLPAFIDATAFRIIQEAMTNVLRHAKPCPVSVSVKRTPAALAVVVTDDGPALQVGEPAAGQRHGIPGMRERAAAVGGTVEAGPTPAGGWRVSALLPLAGRD